MGCRNGWLRSASSRFAVSQHNDQLAVGSPCGVAQGVCSIRPSSVPEVAVPRVMPVRFLLLAVALSMFAILPSARAGLVAGLNMVRDQSGAPSVHVNRVTGEARFVRLQAPTELTLKSSLGVLMLPTQAYPSGVVVDASELPYQLQWRSEQPFPSTFDAGNIFVPELMGDKLLSNSSFKYSPPTLTHRALSPESSPYSFLTDVGGVAVVVPEPTGLCLAIGGLALLAARAPQV